MSAAYNNGFVQWLGLGFSFGKTSMIRNFVLYLFWSVFNHKPLKQSRQTLAASVKTNQLKITILKWK
tara:strand:- start:1709 stop:1909 length:201 start_codon:yes stop_codon:yes gene_type:complete